MAREFKSLEEVQALAGYDSENVLLVDQYDGVEGPYHFEIEVKCRLLKPNGNPCGTEHKHGWILRAKNERLVLVGGKCALEHFGLKSDELLRDMAIATNAIDQAKAKAKLDSLLAEKDRRLPEVREAWERLNKSKRSLQDAHRQLGTPAWRIIERMARSGEAAVVITGVIPGKFDHDLQEIVRDRQTKPIQIGTLKAVPAASSYSLDVALASLKELFLAYQRAATLDASAKSSEVKGLNTALNRHAAVIDEARKADESLATFLKNDFRIIAFAIEEKADRYKAVVDAFAFSGTVISRDKAKVWMQDREAALKQAHGVLKIEHNDSWRRGQLWQKDRPFAA